MNRQNMIAALEIASMSLDKTTFNYFVFGKGTVTCFDHQSVTVTPFENDIDAAVSATLLDFLRKAKGDEVTIKKEGTNVIFKAGKSKASMATTDGYTIPKVPAIDVHPMFEGPDDPEEADALLSDMQTFVKALSWCAAITDKKAQTVKLSHVAMGMDIGATDNYRIRFVKGVGMFHDKQWLAPGDALKCLDKLSEIQNVRIDDGWLCVYDSYQTRYFVRLASEEGYPDLHAMLSVDGVALTFPEDIHDILDRLSVFVDATAPADQEALFKVFANGRGILHREASYGVFDEDFKMTKPEEGGEFLVNPMHLGEALKLSMTGYFAEGHAVFKGTGDDKAKTVLISLG